MIKPSQQGLTHNIPYSNEIRVYRNLLNGSMEGYIRMMLSRPGAKRFHIPLLS